MFKLSTRSLRNLEGVHPDLVTVIKTAITLTKVDFGVGEGLRSRTRQRELVNSGASRTMNSRHITGHAVDLWAYVGSTVRWDWSLYYPIAEAVKQAAIQHDINLIWGGVWDRDLRTLKNTQKAVEDYVTRRRSIGKSAFVDGPHYQLDRIGYPA